MTTNPHRWLCIAYAFPPVNRSGTQRTLGFVRHLAERGWDATVLTADPAGESLDADLLAQVPMTTRVERVPWVDRVLACKQFLGIDPRRAGEEAVQKVKKSKSQEVETVGSSTFSKVRSRNWCNWFTQLLHLPDSRSGWIRPAVRAGLEIIRRDAPTVIYSTAPYLSAHLIALQLQRRTGLPWVADFRDPWRDNPFRSLGHATLDWLDARMERAVLRASDHIVMNTRTARDRLCARFPTFGAKCSVILNGFDSAAFASVTPFRDAAVDQFVLAHAGQFYGPRSPMPWFQALRLVLNQSPQLAARLRLHLIGAEHYDGTPLVELARREGVAAAVRVHGSLPHGETLNRLAGADAVLLAGSDGPGAELQVPAKLFEYLALRRPIIAALPSHSPALAILRAACAPALICAPADVPALASAMESAATGRFRTMPDAWSGVEQFDRLHRAEELRSIFAGVLAPSIGNTIPARRESELLNVAPVCNR